MDNFGHNFRAPKVDVHQFAMIPRADIPRSRFRMQNQHKTTFSASLLIPVFLQEVLPGDSFNVTMTAYCRLATPLFPLMDNMDLESFFFFVPNRLVWSHWVNFQGEQANPADSISFTIPQVFCAAGGFPVNSIFDYFGLPTVGQVGGGNTYSVNVLPLRCYNLIWNQWFRDENLDNSLVFGATGSVSDFGDGPDLIGNYSLIGARRRHDYFTSCLPWTQKGGVAITLPIVGQATVKTAAADLITTGVVNPITFGTAAAMNVSPSQGASGFVAAGPARAFQSSITSNPLNTPVSIAPANLYADLSTATANTINSIRLVVQTQRLLERDARGGTRYTEIVRSHFGVVSPDMRLQRPEYLGGGRSPVNVAPVPQTAQTGLTGGNTPLGTLAGVGTVVAKHGFRASFTEHGHILGLVVVRADQGYQQGLRKLWSRSTRYDFYMPVFAMLGEQAVLNKEIFLDGSANDALTFGFQERWAEYRYHPSFTSGFFRSTSPTPLDAWHLSLKYGALPVLNSSFVVDDLRTTIQRNLALGGASANQQFLADFFFDETVARPMPLYSVPGMMDHF